MLEFRSMTNDYWTVTSVRMIDTLLRLWHWLHSMHVARAYEHHNSSLSACKLLDRFNVRTIGYYHKQLQLSSVITSLHTKHTHGHTNTVWYAYHTPLHLTTRRKWTFMYPECCVLHEKTFEANNITHYRRTAHILQHLSNSQQSIANPLFNW